MTRVEFKEHPEYVEIIDNRHNVYVSKIDIPWLIEKLQEAINDF